MSNNDRIPLSDNLQFSWFDKAMKTLKKHEHQLSQYDRRLFQDLSDGWDFAGREMSITRKQMNHIKQVASEIELGRY